MDTRLFSDWFQKFTEQNKERPMLLLFDGHLSHISIPVVQRAIEENIILLKFPPHVTDILQHLDKCCFGPLKWYWKKTLNERINITGLLKAVDRAEFVNLISSVWHEGMNENVGVLNSSM